MAALARCVSPLVIFLDLRHWLPQKPSTKLILLERNKNFHHRQHQVLDFNFLANHALTKMTLEMVKVQSASWLVPLLSSPWSSVLTKTVGAFTVHSV